MVNLALITARGGSKRLPHKNTSLFFGKPLIAWTIEAAIESNKFDKVIVSTDSSQIAEISEKFGASIPFFRPSCLATDDTPSSFVVNHCLKKIPEAKKIMLLQPTSPLRRSEHIVSAFKLLEKFSSSSVVSVSRRPAKPTLQYILNKNLTLRNLNGDLPTDSEFVSVNGAIYLFMRSWFLKKQKFIGVGTRALVMSTNESVDIDTKADWLEAERNFYYQKVDT